MEEERARQEEVAKKATEEASNQGKGGEQESTSQDVTMTGSVVPAASEPENKTADLMGPGLYEHIHGSAPDIAGQVLVCTPSNVVVDQLAEKISATCLKQWSLHCLWKN